MTETIDIILTDLALPDSTSSSTYVELEIAAPWIPKVILTGREDNDFEIAMKKMGANAYINKSSINSENMCKLVLNIVAANRAPRVKS